MTFDRTTVELGIAGTHFAGQVMHLPTVISTNALALEAAQAGLRSGVWIADEQTGGRGRGNHGWHSSAGDGLYLSALTTPPLTIKAALLLSLATGLAVQRAIGEETNLDVDIRWPNDLLIGKKKCGGILVETAVTQEAALRYAVIGIGINLNHLEFPSEIAGLATSLRIEGGRAVTREGLSIALLRALNDELCALSENAELQREQLLKRFAKASSWIRGKRVRVDEYGGYTGVTAGLDANGFLLVDGDDGIQRTVLSGGVRER